MLQAATVHPLRRRRTTICKWAMRRALFERPSQLCPTAVRLP
jgi:hypothetical protein